MYFNKIMGNYEPNMEEFEEIVKKDIKDGLIPFFCAMTYGYSATFGFDDGELFAKLCKKFW